MNGSPRIDEVRAFATERLRQQKSSLALHVEHGGMELHELHVGHASPGAIRERDAVTGRDFGIGRSRKT